MAKKCLHKLCDILLIGLFTYLSNGEDYEDMVLFAQSHKEFLQPYAASSLQTGLCYRKFKNSGVD
ncbi:MAG: transposase family protein [Dysgonamonadaceae bacterium]|nr:transposase family protein [Dysgonamonadaceae bacterium]